MVLLFLMDLTSSLLFKSVFNVGSWVVYKSINGLQYVYKRVRSNEKLCDKYEYNLDELNSTPYVIITEEEYETTLIEDSPLLRHTIKDFNFQEESKGDDTEFDRNED